MKIIDWETKGNVVRFYLGLDNLEDWWGDDWNDQPYEHNAGKVYEKFIAGIKDVKFDFDDLVIEPFHGYGNSPYSKDDFIDRKVPCLIIVKQNNIPENAYQFDTFGDWIECKKAIKIYFGDNENLLDSKSGSIK